MVRYSEELENSKNFSFLHLKIMTVSMQGEDLEVFEQRDPGTQHSSKEMLNI